VAPEHRSFWGVVSPHFWKIWLAVAAMLLIWKIAIYQSFVHYVKAGREEVSCINALEQFGKIIEETNVKGVIGLYTNKLIASPMLVGFFRPFIVLPSLNISEADFKCTVLHELTHYKRGDMFYKWLAQITMCLHWFNPLMYLMVRELNKSCELSCDESVVKGLDYDGMRAYGDTLVNAISNAANNAINSEGKYSNALSSVTFNANKKDLKERLDMIMSFKKKSPITLAVTLLLTLAIAMGTTVVGVYGWQNPSTATNFDEAHGIVSHGVVSHDFEITIPLIRVHEMVYLGRVDVALGYFYWVTANAAIGTRLFVGATNLRNDGSSRGGTMWSPFSAGDNQVTATITSQNVRYLYVGSSPWSSNATDLHDVTVRVQRLPVIDEDNILSIWDNANLWDNVWDNVWEPWDNIWDVPNSDADGEIDISSFLPFISRDMADEIARDMVARGAFDDEQALAVLPFISRTAADELARGLIKRGSFDNAKAFLPFTSRDGAAEIARYMVNSRQQVDIQIIMPFISRAVADEIVLVMVARGDYEDVYALLPFVSRTVADAIVRAMLGL